ncbi:endoplasmic reticulum transmembrane protein 3 [Monosporozyma servazzii]
MSLYNTIIFGILVAEVIIFSLLALPIPSKYRKPLTLVLLKPFRISTVQITVKCILGFITLLFADSINKVYNINRNELGQLNGMVQGTEKIEIMSRKFLQQRNMYLTGITLFLTFIVTKTFALVEELLTLKATLREDALYDKDKLRAMIDENDKEIDRLKEKVIALQQEKI